MVGKLKDLTVNRDGTQNITVTISCDFRDAFDDLSQDRVSVDIKRWYDRRSLTANAYAWVLIDKIAERMMMSKEEVYRNAIRDIGGVSVTVCVQAEAVKRLCRGWESRGLGWQTEVLSSKIDGCDNVVLYYGSSAYDAKQMAALIDALVQDAEALGIPTMPEEERKKLR